MLKMKKFKAFTLVELMVVCAIIAILAAIVLINLDRSKMRARDAQRKADLTRIAGALENYRVDNKVYPAGTFTPPAVALFTDVSTLIALTTGNYINSLPTNPADQTQYKYASDTNQYKLLAKSEIITTVPDANAQTKAGDFYNSVQQKCFQISSSNTALAWTDSYCN